MKSQFICLLAIIFQFAIYSCKKTEVRPDYKENIKIKMIEKVDSANRVLQLICQTDTIFPCNNYMIETTFSLTNDKITIDFIKTVFSPFCLLSPGPASAVIDLNGLSNKVYGIELNFGTTTITGQLAVTANSFIASLPAQTKARFVNPDLKRIPDNTIYGRVGYGTASLGPLAQTFIDSLQVYGATPASYPAGDYNVFQIDTNGQIIPTMDGYHFRKNFIFHYSNSSGQLKGLVKRYGNMYRNILSVTLNTAKGESFYSWVP